MEQLIFLMKKKQKKPNKPDLRLSIDGEKSQVKI